MLCSVTGLWDAATHVPSTALYVDMTSGIQTEYPNTGNLKHGNPFDIY
jgi:hypothetical protein